MTDKEKEAIERCRELIKTEHSNWIGISNQKAIETVLDIIQTQQAEIEQLKQAGNAMDLLLKQKIEEIKKKDKQIDLMASCIATLDIEEDICFKVENENCDKMNFGECEDCIKQYFKNLAEKREKGKEDEK